MACWSLVDSDSLVRMDQTLKPFEFIEHTGDLGVLVYGNGLPELFGNAAEAFFEVITDPEKVLERESRSIFLDSNDLEELLVAWLSEFLYLFDTNNLLFRRFSVHKVKKCTIEATAWGEVYDGERHPIKTVIKAVTFHQIQVREEKGIWKARVIFDL